MLKNFISLGKKAVFSLIILCSAKIYAENFRVHKTVFIQVPQTEASKKVECGINDGLAIKLPADRTFIQGIEILIKVPAIVTKWQDSVAWSFYSDILPEPSESTIDYQGTRHSVHTFSNSLSLNIQLPLKQNNTIKKSPYAVYVSHIPTENNGIIFLRMQLVMKGIDDNIGVSNFEISVKPILTNNGYLKIRSESPDGSPEIKPYTAFADGKPLELPQNKIILEKGTHTINFVSDFYRNEVRTVNIAPGTTTYLDIQFRDIAPTVNLYAPKNTTVYMDGTIIDQWYSKDSITVSQGDHQFKFVIGDWETVRSINAINGHSYNISLTIDSNVEEQD